VRVVRIALLVRVGTSVAAEESIQKGKGLVLEILQMPKRYLLVMTVGLVSGFIGGLASQLVHVVPSGRGVVRGTRLELTDDAGRTLAFLGRDSERNTALVFVDKAGRERARFGVWSGGSTPFMVMTGSDGVERVRIRLGRWKDRPSLLLHDEQRVRVHLGFFENDVPGPADEGWALRLMAPDDRLDDAARFGIYRGSDGQIGGYVMVRRPNGTHWSEP
jgi:hypothetical protein